MKFAESSAPGIGGTSVIEKSRALVESCWYLAADVHMVGQNLLVYLQ